MALIHPEQVAGKDLVAMGEQRILSPIADNQISALQKCITIAHDLRIVVNILSLPDTRRALVFRQSLAHAALLRARCAISAPKAGPYSA